MPAAEALETKHPLAATLIRRALIDFSLGAARTSRYRHAARHLLECQGLANQIEDFGAIETHEAYRARLKSEHGRKASFWSLLECLPFHGCLSFHIACDLQRSAGIEGGPMTLSGSQSLFSHVQVRHEVLASLAQVVSLLGD